MELDITIEVPRGCHNKYEVDHETGRLRLDRRLFTAMAYPTDYGFIENTLGRDGDPLDALLLIEDSVFPGCLVRVRPVAVFEMTDEHGPDEKILCVVAGDPRQEDIRDLENVSPFVLDEIRHFFANYKVLEPGKRVEPDTGWDDRQVAERFVLDAQARAGEHRS